MSSIYNFISSNNLLKKTVGILAIFGLVYIIYFLFVRKASFDDNLKEIALELNKTCPKMIDKETRLDNALAIKGNIFQYNYTLLNILKDSMDIELYKASVEPSIVNNVITNPDLETFRKNKITLIYNFKDELNNHITRIIVGPKKYKN
jgi:hypothetical protein